MSFSEEIKSLIGAKESETLEYKTVLPPSRSIAEILSAFANTSGGYLVLGVGETPRKEIIVKGISEDFHAKSITHKALDLLSPRPVIEYDYVVYENKTVFAIKVLKSDLPISVENKIYKRNGQNIEELNPVRVVFNRTENNKIKTINDSLITLKRNSTVSNNKLIEHYQSILKIIDDLGSILYPVALHIKTTIQEGKILTRILFSSFVDNFETYLSDLLYEIYLAKPQSLKSEQKVTVEEVLNCSDLQEFVKYVAKQKLDKLQKGSVKGFIKENKQISDLKVLDNSEQNDIEKILQIRHLYSHRNGIVDEKFLQYYPGEYLTNSEHQMSIDEVCDKLLYLAELSNKIDVAAIMKYSLTQ